MKSSSVWLGPLILVALAAFAFASCGGGEDKGGGTPVDVELNEFYVIPKPASVPAGRITFSARNIGQAEHELLIVKVDNCPLCQAVRADGQLGLVPDALPTKEDGSFNEESPGVQIIDKIDGFTGEEKLTVDLAPGNYVLMDNLVHNYDGKLESHYKEGMSAAFTVE
jgi:hypothetical protein